MEFSRKMAHQTLSKKTAITTPHTFGNVPRKMFQQKKVQTNSKTPFPKTAGKLLTKEIRSVTLHVDKTPGTKRNRTHIAFYISQPYFDTQHLLQDSTLCPLTRTKFHAACHSLVPHADPLGEDVQVPSACFASLGFVTLPCPLQNMRQCHVVWQRCG